MSDSPTNVVAGAETTNTNTKKTVMGTMFSRPMLEIPESDYMRIRSGKKKGSSWEPHGLDPDVESDIRKVLYKHKKCYVKNCQTGATIPLSLD